MDEALAAPAIRSLRLPELLLVLGCPATSSSTTSQLLEALCQGGGWVVWIVRVVELVGVASEVVQFSLAGRVLYVLRAAARADDAVGGGRARIHSVRFQKNGASPGGGVLLEHRLQGASIDVVGRVHVRQIREGGQVVCVEYQLVGSVPRSDIGTAHQ